MLELVSGSVGGASSRVFQTRLLVRLAALMAFAIGYATNGGAFAQTLPPYAGARVQQIVQSADAASAQGQPESALHILEQGLLELGNRHPDSYWLFWRLATHHSDAGDMVRTIENSEHALSVARYPGQELLGIIYALAGYSVIHDRAKIADYRGQLERLMPRLRSASGWARFADLWQAQISWSKAVALLYEGKYAEAEVAYRACLGSLDYFQSVSFGPKLPLDAACNAGLMEVLANMGKLTDAAGLADQLRSSLDGAEKQPGRQLLRFRFDRSFVRLALEQGKLPLAEQLLSQSLGISSGIQGVAASHWVAQMHVQYAQVEMLRGRWNEAIQRLERRARLLGEGATLTSDHVYALVRAGRQEDALRLSSQHLQDSTLRFDENSTGYWEAHAYHGLALAAVGKKEEAVQSLRVAVPRYLDLIKGERTSSDAGVLRTARLNWLLDGYIRLLSDHAANGDAAALDEAFRMADLARGSTVQRALAASASRANVSDPALADLARREQDLQREISSLAESIGNLLARGRVAEQDKVVAAMRADLTKLREQHTKTQAEIERRFPDYFALLNPKPVGIAAIQKLLKPTEAAISVYAGSDRSLVWAIPAQGAPSFAIVPLTGEQLDLKVMTLREALDPNADAAGKLPRFRFDISHELYTRLLAPVEAGWKNAKELIVIPHGRLGQLPFGVLTTAPYSAKPARLEYAEMADAPWLIKQIAISQLPAAVAMPALRAGAGVKAERAFIGFGDPVFMADAAAAAAGTRGIKKRGIQRRNLAVGEPGSAPAKPAGDADPQLAPPINFKLLPQLPDTSLEIEEVGGVLSAERSRDIFLFERASESLVKQTDLSPYRVVMFATHGLMNGEMPGLYQPALALSNPSVTGEKEDGMLTMEEILGLKLKADWVVLSACNSAAAGGQSSESVSGLGRAFFYAGAKSLLVTNWAVETESARMLTTEAFRLQAKDPTLPRARALQQSSLVLMKKSAGSDYSYAHPMFWAPYTLVGDGG